MFSFFGTKRGENIAVIHLSSGRAAAAYAHVSGVAPPGFVYAAEVEIPRAGGNLAALRALEEVAREMAAKGAPALRQVTGSGSVSKTLFLIGSPWQTTSLSTKTISKETPFLFTHAMIAEALKVEEGTAKLVGTVLNGYETPEPIGKKVTRAELSVLSSRIDPEIQKMALRAVRGVSGAAPLSVVSFPETALSVLKGFFPHERDFLAVQVGIESTEIAFVKGGHLAGVETAATGTGALAFAAENSGVSQGVAVDGIIDREKSALLGKRLASAEGEWTAAMREAFLKVASEGALPRAIFLFADERALPLFTRLLNAAELHALWLSDEPLSVIEMDRGRFAPYLRFLDERVRNDPMLDLLALLARIEPGSARK